MKFSFFFFFLFSFLLLIPIISSSDLTFQYGKEFDIKRPCFNNGTYCTLSRGCNLSITYPDGSSLLNNGVMTNNETYSNYTIFSTSNNQLGELSATMMCCDSAPLIACNFNTFTIEITGDGEPYRTFPHQFSIIIMGFLMIGAGFAKENLRIFKTMGAMVIILMGVLTLYPGYSFINWTTLMGKGMGFTFLGLGFYFLIEDGFSREKQVETYQQNDDGRFHNED